MLVYQEGKTLARVGVMGEATAVQDAPILRKCLRDGRDGREQYLAALQVRGVVQQRYWCPFVVVIAAVVVPSGTYFVILCFSRQCASMRTTFALSVCRGRSVRNPPALRPQGQVCSRSLASHCCVGTPRVRVLGDALSSFGLFQILP